jgi:hypothetical protein
MKLHMSKKEAAVMRAGLVASLCTAALVAGCAEHSTAGGPVRQESPGTPSQSDSGLPQGSDPVTLDPADFTTEITNHYWPMKAGTRWISRETDEEGNAFKVVVTVTGVTKKIANGITARVVRDTVSSDGEVVEDTFDWYAQDADGNIWYLGEDTFEFNDGKASHEGSFEAGVDGALPGVAVPGTPEDGMAYRQEYYKGEAEDNGEVLSTEEMAEVPAGKYDNVLLTRDTSGIEPGVEELKFYAPGVGPVLTLGVSGDIGREEMLSMTQVSPKVASEAGTTPLGKPYA